MDNDYQQDHNSKRGPGEGEGWLTPFGAAGLACAGARVLVPGHLDRELSAVQANELRGHLLDCGACRRVLKQETDLRRWFQEGLPGRVPVPTGFAERLARRAFQGDPGIDFSEAGSDSSHGSFAGIGAENSVDADPIRRPKRGALLSFLLASTAAAAVALFSFAVLLQQETLPQGDQLHALDYVPPWERGANQSLESGSSEAGLAPEEQADQSTQKGQGTLSGASDKR